MRGDITARFWAKVRKGDICWTWQAAKDQHGYGRFGISIDHLCRNTACVNPDHMEVVTRGENVRRGVSAVVQRNIQARKTHCPRGHEYSPENTYITAVGGRSCRTCRREVYQPRQNAKRRAA